MKKHLDDIFLISYIPDVECIVEFTDEFEEWWNTLSESEQVEIDAVVTLLEIKGTTLPHPYSTDVHGSKYGQMRELRIQHAGDPYRVLYAFDPRRMAILLIGGNKTGNKRWYKKFVPIADRLFGEHLKDIKGKE